MRGDDSEAVRLAMEINIEKDGEEDRRRHR